MHEVAIANQLVDQVLVAAGEHGATRVRSVELEVGELEAIVPEAMQTAFAAATEGTIAEGAELVIREVPPAARCRQCGADFVPRIAYYACPECGRADAEIMAGRGIILQALDCVTD